MIKEFKGLCFSNFTSFMLCNVKVNYFLNISIFMKHSGIIIKRQHSWFFFLLHDIVSVTFVSSDVHITRDNGRLQKQSHQLAVQNAFSKIVLAVLGNGQVFVDERPLTPAEVAELLPVELVESQTLQVGLQDIVYNKSYDLNQ